MPCLFCTFPELRMGEFEPLLSVSNGLIMIRERETVLFRLLLYSSEQVD